MELHPTISSECPADGRNQFQMKRRQQQCHLAKSMGRLRHEDMPLDPEGCACISIADEPWLHVRLVIDGIGHSE